MTKIENIMIFLIIIVQIALIIQKTYVNTGLTFELISKIYAKFTAKS